MNFSFLIAIRYFLSKKRGNFVHLASWASIIGVAIGTAALILVLSVFNGFEKLILDMYNSFDPHIKITSACGKAFDPVGIKINSPDVIEKSYVLEEQVLLRYQDRQVFATVKGVSTSFKRLTNFDSLLVQGNYFDHSESENLAVIGRGIAHRLSLSLDNKFEKLHVYLPNRSATTLLNSSTAFRQSFVIPTGVFSVQSEINEKYIITPLSFIQNLADRDRGVSSIELKLVNNDRTSQLQKKLKLNLGDNFIIQNRLEQQDFLYKILNSEKLVVFLILTFIMIIATFNIIGLLSMLILNKKKDIKTLMSFGATSNQVEYIFFIKSLLTILTGIFIGLIIGLSLSYLQQNFGFISLGGASESFVVKSYPVIMKVYDIITVSATVLFIGLLACWYPTKVLLKRLV